jgi:ABC-type amino acid transport substrate-binding protein
MRRTLLSSSLIVVAMSLVACSAASTGSSANSAGGTTSAAAATCTPADLSTHTAGKLTVATDSPAYEPWFSNNKPANGKGFESAVAFAVAKQLGYTADQVKWVTASFNSVIAPTPKKYDFDINEVSITPARAKAVDFSTGYYDVAQSVITLKGSKIAKAKSIADLHGAKLGAQQGTTSLDAITGVIKPGTTPAEYPTNDSGRPGAEERPDRRTGGRLADRPLHHGGRAGQQHHRRAAAGDRDARAVRPGPDEGQPAHVVRLEGRRCPSRGRDAHRAPAAVADDVRRRS